MTEPKPMDPERLADLRGGIQDKIPVPVDLAAELLADRDYSLGLVEKAASTIRRLRGKARAYTTLHAQLIVMAGLDDGTSVAECVEVIRARLDRVAA